MTDLLIVFAATLGALLLGAGVLHLIPFLGPPGRRLSEWLCRAPGLDIPITYFTAAPLVAGPIVAGWLGLLGAVAGQVAAVMAWTVLHELAHLDDRRGPRIVAVINSKVGRVRNHLAVWTTALVVPVFWIIRVAEYVVYPPLIHLVRFPRYRHAEWVNVSRHKFRGLVGHDLIWCLYCDWMTGVWSLGAEMLRNVESFWCPIRFDSAKKCENCRHDFPDIEGGWVPSDADMETVTGELDRRYPGPGGRTAWWGHPVRLTIGGSEASRDHESEPRA